MHSNATRSWALIFSVVAAGVLRAATIAEDFSADPTDRGWRTFGDASLFRWNATNQNLEVTWDSARTNSYYWLPLGTILSRADDFAFSFDLRLTDIAIGTTSNKPYTFEIATGLMRMSNAMATNYFRGAGVSASGPRNLVEFDYFPDSGYGATFSPTVATTNNTILFSDNHPLVMGPGDLFHIAMTYTASNRVLHAVVLRNGIPYSTGPSNALKNLQVGTNQDFRVDAVAIMSYSDAVQVGSPQFWGSVLAHGTIDNVALTLPPNPVADLAIVSSNGGWRAQFNSQTNWSYALERTIDARSWTAVSGTNLGTGTTMVLQDTNVPGPHSFYRVKALRP